jgi:hypothetical protein
MVKLAPNANPIPPYLQCPVTKPKTPTAKSSAPKPEPKHNGRKIGTKLNLRNEKGWSIPKPGTLRRKVYDMLMEGLSVKAIADRMKWSKRYAEQVIYIIRNPEKFNARRYRQRHKK